MSADRINNSIKAEVKKAERTTNTRELAVIRERLLQLGAWAEAEHVALKARELQLQMERLNG
jgi:hypothetical protein